MWVNCLFYELFQVTKAFQMMSHTTICLHIMATGLEPSNVLNLWSNILQSMMKLHEY